MMPLTEALDRIGRTGGCVAQEPPARFREYDRITWSDCPRDASVDLLVHNGGHTIPLSWYSTVVDWFEQGLPDGRPTTARDSTGGTGTTPRFKSAGSGRAGGRFKKARELPPQ